MTSNTTSGGGSAPVEVRERRLTDAQRRALAKLREGWVYEEGWIGGGWLLPDGSHTLLELPSIRTMECLQREGFAVAATNYRHPSERVFRLATAAGVAPPLSPESPAAGETRELRGPTDAEVEDACRWADELHDGHPPMLQQRNRDESVRWLTAWCKVRDFVIPPRTPATGDAREREEAAAWGPTATSGW